MTTLTNTSLYSLFLLSFKKMEQTDFSFLFKKCSYCARKKPWENSHQIWGWIYHLFIKKTRMQSLCCQKQFKIKPHKPFFDRESLLLSVRKSNHFDGRLRHLQTVKPGGKKQQRVCSAGSHTCPCWCRNIKLYQSKVSPILRTAGRKYLVKSQTGYDKKISQTQSTTNRFYLIVLSEVKRTMWGSNVSQGYQAACFKVRDVELVKNLSAIGIVLKHKAENCTVARNTVTSKWKSGQEEPEIKLKGFTAISCIILIGGGTALTWSPLLFP